MNVLVVSRSYPPSVSGSSSIMYRLLHNGDDLKFIVLRGRLYPRADRPMRVKTYSIDMPGKLQYITIAKYLFIPFIVCKIAAIIFKEKIDVVLSVYPHANYIIAAFIASRLFNKPHSIYFHDLWEEGRSSKVEKKIARLIEPVIARNSRKTFVLSDAIKEFLDKKYGIETIIVPHTIDHSQLVEKPLEWKPPYRICFIGAIHSMNKGLLVDLAKEILQSSYLQFDIYTQVPEHAVKSYGIDGPNIFIKMLPPQEVFGKLQDEHILYLPFVFNHGLTHEIRTLLPTRVFDCIASRRPIIVHAPKEYSIVKLVARHQFAIHVADPAPRVVLESIKNIINNIELRNRLESACRGLIERHEMHAVGIQFRKVLYDISMKQK